MVRRTEPEPTDHDERLGEAIESYLELAEGGTAPEPEEFARNYPDLSDDLLAALEGLALVRGLVGEPEGSGAQLETGRRIAGYRIVRELGRGGMGVVYEAVHVDLDRPVALKVLGTHAAPDSTGRRRFLNEARTAAGLHHTHIVPVFDVGQVGGLCYYAMQRIEGSGLDRVIRHLRRGRSTAGGSTPGPGGISSLRTRLLGSKWSRSPAGNGRRKGSESETGSWHGGQVEATELSLPSAATEFVGKGPRRRDRDDEPPPFEPPRGSAYYRWVAEVGRQAADALGHAHHRGVIHRDVKPSNLLVDARGLVWVADFGLARNLADPGLTQYDSMLGTPRYMSPEQAKVGPIDGRTDLYSLGATLYELLALRPPFEGRSAAELIEQIADREPISPRQFDPRIPRDLETIVLKLLAKRPADRYASAAEVSSDLTRFANLEPVKARRISPVGRLWRFARRHPGITAVSTAAAVAVLTVSTIAYVKVLQQRDEANQARAKTESEMRLRLLHHAAYVRKTDVPNRRATGLALLKDAAARNPEPELRTKLRNEAIEFLAIRDVEPRDAFPTGRSRGIAFGPDGTRLATYSMSEEGPLFRLWDVSQRKPLVDRLLRAPNTRGGGAGSEPNSGQGKAGSGGGRFRGFGMNEASPVLAVAGHCIAVLTPDGQSVRLFDANTGAKVSELELPGHRSYAILAAPDGQRIVTLEAVGVNPRGGGGGPGAPMRYEVNLWDAEHLDAPLANLAKWTSEVGQPAPEAPLAAISPDGKTVVTAHARKSVVSVWSGETGKELGPPIDTQAELTALALGSDDQLATAASGEVRLWDLDSRSPLPSFMPNPSYVRLMRFSPRGSLLAVGGFLGRSVELWDTAAHALVAVLPTAEPVDDVAFSPDGRLLAAAGQGASSSVWAILDSNVRAHVSGFDATTRVFAYRADGLLAMGRYNGSIRFWSAGSDSASDSALQATGADFGREKDDPAARDRQVMLSFDDQGRLLTLEPDALWVWDAPPKRFESSRIALPGGAGPPTRLSSLFAMSADGRTLALTRGPQMLLWSANDPAKVHVVRLPGSQPGGRGERGIPSSMVWGAKGLAVASGGSRLYYVDNFGVHALSLEPRSDAEVLDARTLPWADAPNEATTLALSPDATLLAVGHRSGSITLIGTKTGKTLSRFEPPSRDAEGGVWSLAFSPTGKELAVGTQQGHIDIWSPADASAPLFRLPGHRGYVASLAFDARGRYLASAGSDKTVDVWDLVRIREESTKMGLAW